MPGLRHTQSHVFQSTAFSSPSGSSNGSSGTSTHEKQRTDVTSQQPISRNQFAPRRPYFSKLRSAATEPYSTHSGLTEGNISTAAIDSDGRRQHSSALRQAKSHSFLRLHWHSSPHSNGFAGQAASTAKFDGQRAGENLRPIFNKGLLKNGLPEQLGKLPDKAWEIIASYLPPVDRAFLALSCRFLWSSLAPKAFKDINAFPCKLDKLEFLRYFHAHLPDHVLCPKCVTFHPHGKRNFHFGSNELFSHVSQTFMQKDCVRRAAKAFLFGIYELEWWQVQMITRAQLISPRYGIQVRALCLESKKPHGAWYSSSEATVVGGHLLVKIHSVRPFDFCSKKCHETKVETTFPTCPHLNETTTLTKACQHVTSSVKEPSPDNPNFKRVSKLFRCEWCPSEYQVELRATSSDNSRAAIKARRKDCRFLLCVSRWIDAGEGLCPESEEWFDLTTIRKHGGKGATYKGLPYDIGTLPAIKCRYEGETDNLKDGPVESICAIGKAT